MTYNFYRSELHPKVTPFSLMFIDVRDVFKQYTWGRVDKRDPMYIMIRGAGGIGGSGARS